MGVLRGAEVSLEGLLGYGKLQDLLALIIAQLDEQECGMTKLREGQQKQEEQFNKVQGLTETVQELRSASKESEQRLQEEFGQLEELRDSLSEGGGLSQRVEELEAKVDALEAQAKAQASELPALRAAPAAAAAAAAAAAEERLAKSLEELRAAQVTAAQQASAALREASEGIREDLDAMPARWAEDILADVDALRQEVAAEQQALVERATKLEEGVGELVEGLKKVQETFADFDENFLKQRKDLLASAEEIQGQCLKMSEVFGDLRSRVAALEHSTKKGGGGAASEEQLAAVGEAAGRLEGELGRLQAGVEALSEKEGSDFYSLSRLISQMREQMKQLLDRGASATARCLTCHEPRKQVEDRIIIGTDGKPYRRRPSSQPDSPASSCSGSVCGDGDRRGHQSRPLSAPTGPRGLRRVQSAVVSGSHLHGGAGAVLRRFRDNRQQYESTFLPPAEGAARPLAAAGSPSAGLNRSATCLGHPLC